LAVSGEVEQDRAGLDHGVRLAARPVVINDDRDLVVGVDLGKFRLVLIALPDVDEVFLVGQPAFLEHDVDFLHVGAGERVKIDHGIGLCSSVFRAKWTCRGERIDTTDSRVCDCEVTQTRG